MSNQINRKTRIAPIAAGSKEPMDPGPHRPPTELFLDTQNLARKLGLSPCHLANLRVYGGGPKFFKLGRRCLYRWDDVEKGTRGQRRWWSTGAGRSESAVMRPGRATDPP